LEFKGFGTSSASPSECRPCGTPSESSTSTPCGLICIKDVGLQGQQEVIHRAGMQMLPTGLLSCEESMAFIIDVGASRTLT